MSKIGEAKKKIVHFYCYTCKEYELKTSPHYRAQKARFARRRKTKATKLQAESPEKPAGSER
jgi:hypothetical protein